jgi:cell fate regulator YaaT (PSP1 superfamily)
MNDTAQEIQILENEETEQKSESKSRFTEGDELTFIRVRFPGNSKSFPFLLGSHPFRYGQKVLAQSDRGLGVGYINSFPYKKSFKKNMLPIQTIARVATEDDITQQSENAYNEKKAEVDCQNLIEKHKLDMTLTHVEFMQNGKKAVFYFNAPARVDFRDLVKDLVGILKIRVELRQISVRDRTAALGALGACGLQTCCSSFLQNYGHVNIKMPKNQNLSIAQNRINGVCGQIKCCMKYEDEVYSHKKKNLPKEGKYVKLLNGDTGKVLKLHILKEQFDMLTDKGTIRRYTCEIYNSSNHAPAQNWSFPREFNLITNETNEVVKWSTSDISDQEK